MGRAPLDEAREHRITMEIVVDAYGPDERAMGWYVYLEDHLAFPFHARCSHERVKSPLEVGDRVEVVGMAPEDECEDGMFVMIWRARRNLAVPLEQLEVEDRDDDTRQAAEDWCYWVARGHRF